MGFAGQVFAARVAIGLAVPSPRAMSETGSMLAKGASGIYEKLALMRRQAAMKNAGITNTELQKASGLLVGNLQKTNALINAEISKSMQDMAASGRNVSRAFEEGGTQFEGLRKGLGETDLGKDLFAGVDKMAKPFQKMEQMTKNLHKMDADGRREVLALAREQEQAEEDKLADMYKELDALQKQAQGFDKRHTVQKKKNREEQEALTERIRAQQIITKQAKNDTKDIKTQINLVDRIKNKYKGFTEQAQKFGAAMTQTANHIRTGFNEALRNTIALATAFYYKLNQSTQQLIEFERELLNANSVFNLTNDNLFKVGNTITEFGQQFGMEMQNGATGLYQLASAGVDANEALEILPSTLKLSMAVQGDHNTISKLTAQTLFGFGMEMDQAALLTDKFAFAIQKSLIEYEDLSSAVKFALPFFTSTGQSIDQLLGALQVLTNRALEAGIAGRGLRQALAEFAESAMDAEVGFRKMGVEILNSQGEMLQLSEIAAQFAAAVGPETASNTELLTTLIQDLNVRGATAFIHLVQASDEFTKAVHETKNAGGQLDEMVRIQNESISSQIQILKNNVAAIFLLRDASYEGTEFMNQFHEAVVNTVADFKDLIVVQKDGAYELTEFGMQIQTLATDGVMALAEVLKDLIDTVIEFTNEGLINRDMIELLLLPTKMLLEVLNAIGPSGIKMIIMFKLLNTIIPITTLLMTAYEKKLISIAALQRMAGIGLVIGAGVLAANFLSNRQSGGYVTPMASGGRPQGGGAYMVGEQGPELFIPDRPGKILNSMQTQESIGSGKTVMKNVSIGIDSFGGLV